MQSPKAADLGDEIPTLIATLHATEKRLEELTGGEIDTVSSESGQPFLLRRAQAELRRSEAAKQAAIINALPAQIALLDAQSTVVSVNESWKQFSSANFLQGPTWGLGINYIDLCERARGDGSEDAHRVAVGIRSVLTNGGTFSHEYPCHSPSEQRWFQMTVTPLKENLLRGAVVMHVEVTERKRAEAAFKELSLKTGRRERMLTTTLSNLSDFAYIFDRAGRFLFANQPLLDLWNVTLETVIGKEFFQLGYPDELARRLKRQVREVFETKKSLTDETDYVSPGGKKGFYEYIFTPAVGADGAVEFVVGSTRDITERTNSREALQASKEHFQMLAALADAMRPLNSPNQIMAVATKMLGEHLNVSRCVYADVEGDGERVTIPQDYTSGCASSVGKYQLSQFGEHTRSTLKRGQVLVIRDIEAEVMPNAGGKAFKNIGIGAIIACPLVKGDTLCALIAVHQSTPRDWHTNEIAIVQEVATRCWATIERRLGDETLRKSEAMLRIAGRAARLGGWSFEVPEFRLTWSDEVCAIHEVPRGTTPTMEEAFAFYPPPSAEVIRHATSVCAQQGMPFDLELEIVTAKGKLLGVRSIGEAERDSTGVITRVRGAFQDITESKQVADELQASEKRFKTLFEQAAVGVVLTDIRSGRFVQVNQRFCEITGRSRSEMEELTFASITHPQDVARDLEKMLQLKTGEIRESTWEKRYLRKDGSEVWVSLTVSAMCASGEIPDHCVVVAQDITERKKMEEQLLQSQKMDALGTLAGGIAHDFNNVLAAINGYTELSRMHLVGNPEVHGYLGSVLQASGRATELVRQILTFSRHEVPERRHISLFPVVEETVKLLRASIPSTIEFEVDLSPDSPEVLADATQIHQILMNLGTNAWHAMKDRAGRLHVKLEKRVVDETFATTQGRLRPGVYACISVSDNGTGIEPATLRRIFEPFFTTKPVGQGTGLGLAVVHGIMSSHDGAVSVYSQPGEGTVFHLYFPARTGEGTSAISVDEPLILGNGERVLFVDDEELLVQLGRRTLTSLGYTVETLNDPLAALELVRRNPTHFDLVITDQTMPRMTGFALAGELLRLRPNLPIIVMTGYGLTLTPERVEASGIRQLLIKPTTIHSLGTAVRAALSSPSNS